MRLVYTTLLTITLFVMSIQHSIAKELVVINKLNIELFLDEIARQEFTFKDTITIKKIDIKEHKITIFTDVQFSYIPFRKDNVAKIYSGVEALLPKMYDDYDLSIVTAGCVIEDLIPRLMRGAKSKPKDKTFTNFVDKPLIRRMSVPYIPKEGLLNRHIALWQSHGLYYESKLARWEWQRARIFQTVEDLYTQSYVLQFLVPMLENAGATVILPRERDTQTDEVIIDNDDPFLDTNTYIEEDGTEKWLDGTNPGFAHLRRDYNDLENPFVDGTYRKTEVVSVGKTSKISWVPNIHKQGKYAVYVSYKSLTNSVEDARYTVSHMGGVSEFRVNQTMGGGTWIYLGHFSFDVGISDCRVVLSNKSEVEGRIVTADAVKIGGGYGNIARSVSEQGVSDNVTSSGKDTVNTIKQRSKINYPYETSGYPRFCEASRYWLQWAGVPDSIYSASYGINDYVDDYKSRGLWVNYISGGSSVRPEEKGLNIPIDMAFAFHSDAGTTLGDTIVGTLGIFSTENNHGKFANNVSRYASRDLTDLIQSNIVRDIRAQYEPTWSRRGMWDKAYNEANTPGVPTMLLELLSHQNFADMRYGLDPRFRFSVSRSIYKGMLQFISSQYNTEYTVQPLPVDNMALKFKGKNMVKITWEPVVDSLEKSANAEKYIVYTRVGGGDFDNGTVVSKKYFNTEIPSDVVCSFKVTALNAGGESFPSEILSVGTLSKNKGTVLIVNGFDRISAPADFSIDNGNIAGFWDRLDYGVPYIEDISYIGSMKEFRRDIPWMDDDASGFGDSYSTHEKMVIAGNTFDYPAIHGKAILNSGYSFTSCSDEAIENKSVEMSNYKYVDLILGKEYQTKIGHGEIEQIEFKTFTKKMQNAIIAYCRTNGNILVSGAYVASDLWDNRIVESNDADKEFAMGVLKYKWRVGQAALNGDIKCVASPFLSINGEYTYFNELNSESYIVEAPDAVEPATERAHTILRYSENNISAGIAYKGEYKTCILGFPFESIRTDEQRDKLMSGILTFFQENNVVNE